MGFWDNIDPNVLKPNSDHVYAYYYIVNTEGASFLGGEGRGLRH